MVAPATERLHAHKNRPSFCMDNICVVKDHGAGSAVWVASRYRAHQPACASLAASCSCALPPQHLLRRQHGTQVHPVVSRLCAPIEGTDAARLADCLGLDPAKYHAAAASAGSGLRDALEDALIASTAMLDSDARYKVTLFICIPLLVTVAVLQKVVRLTTAPKLTCVEAMLLPLQLLSCNR